ncbi:hypothetical protein WICPIJ_010125 [Wickerhamomyces pijperi]|uniref:Uncharacterized protein n=1 Tax=Wickerhamomyces pijperi TaxID=599730 RepID=A0A9P8PHK6_WICPI|nr:hypothetical protein WICPIJ_010125 [Wickerhamomyces pijperi]
MLFLEHPEEVKNEILDVNNKDLLHVEVTLLPRLVSAPKVPTASPKIKTKTRMKMSKIASAKTPVYTRPGISKYEHLLLDKVKSPYYQDLSEIVELRSVNRYKYLARLKTFVEKEVQTVSLDYLDGNFRDLAYKAWKVDDDFYEWVAGHKKTIRKHLNPKFINTLGTDRIYTPDGLKRQLDNYEVMVIPHLDSHKRYQYLFKTAMKILLRGLEHYDQKKVMRDCAKKIYTTQRYKYVIQTESNSILDLVKFYIHESEQLGYEPKAISIRILSDATSWTEEQVQRKIERSYLDVLRGLKIIEATFE